MAPISRTITSRLNQSSSRPQLETSKLIPVHDLLIKGGPVQSRQFIEGTNRRIKDFNDFCQRRDLPYNVENFRQLAEAEMALAGSRGISPWHFRAIDGLTRVAQALVPAPQRVLAGLTRVADHVVQLGRPPTLDPITHALLPGRSAGEALVSAVREIGKEAELADAMRRGSPPSGATPKDEVELVAWILQHAETHAGQTYKLNLSDDLKGWMESVFLQHDIPVRIDLGGAGGYWAAAGQAWRKFGVQMSFLNLSGPLPASVANFIPGDVKIADERGVSVSREDAEIDHSQRLGNFVIDYGKGTFFDYVLDGTAHRRHVQTSGRIICSGGNGHLCVDFRNTAVDTMRTYAEQHSYGMWAFLHYLGMDSPEGCRAKTQAFVDFLQGMQSHRPSMRQHLEYVPIKGKHPKNEALYFRILRDAPGAVTSFGVNIGEVSGIYSEPNQAAEVPGLLERLHRAGILQDTDYAQFVETVKAAELTARDEHQTEIKLAEEAGQEVPKKKGAEENAAVIVAVSLMLQKSLQIPEIRVRGRFVDVLVQKDVADDPKQVVLAMMASRHKTANKVAIGMPVDFDLHCFNNFDSPETASLVAHRDAADALANRLGLSNAKKRAFVKDFLSNCYGEVSEGVRVFAIPTPSFFDTRGSVVSAGDSMAEIFNLHRYQPPTLI